MPGFIDSAVELIQNTHVLEQIQAVDAHGLFTNPWFLVPFVGYIGYLAFKKSITTLVMIGLFVGVWMFSGSSYMEGLIVKGEIQVGKILPVAGIGIAVIAIAVYFIFMRSD